MSDWFQRHIGITIILVDFLLIFGVFLNIIAVRLYSNLQFNHLVPDILFTLGFCMWFGTLVFLMLFVIYREITWIMEE